MAKVIFEKEITALLVVDPYNDFISEGGKLWDRIRAVAEANDCVPHMLQVLNAARNAKLPVFYALHHRYRPGDYETWNNTRLRDRKVSKIHSKMNPRRATQSIVIGIGPISNVDGRQTNLLWNNCKRYKNIKGSSLDLR